QQSLAPLKRAGPNREQRKHTTDFPTLTFVSVQPQPPSDDNPPAQTPSTRQVFLAVESIQDDSRVRVVQPPSQVRQGLPWMMNICRQCFREKSQDIGFHK
ncbi:hypothetical protein ABOM_001310, partial [Aspergillus bombycis]